MYNWILKTLLAFLYLSVLSGCTARTPEANYMPPPHQESQTSPLPNVTTGIAASTPISSTPGQVLSGAPSPTAQTTSTIPFEIEKPIQQAPLPELLFRLPPSLLHVEPSPDERWWAMQLLGNSVGEGPGPQPTSLEIVDSESGQAWTATTLGTTANRNYVWLSDSQIVWLDQENLYIAEGNGNNRRSLNAPEAMFTILGRGNNVVLLDGSTGLWRLEFPGGSWDKVPEPVGEAASLMQDYPRSNGLLSLTDDESGTVILSPLGRLLSLPMIVGEQPTLISSLPPFEYPFGDGPSPTPPTPLANSPYIMFTQPIRLAESSETTQHMYMLLDTRDGTLISLSQLLNQNSFVGQPMLSPNRHWISVNLSNQQEVMTDSAVSYIAATSDLSSGRIISGTVIGWQNEPPAVFTIEDGTQAASLVRVSLLPDGGSSVLIKDIDFASAPNLASTPEVQFISSQNWLYAYGLDGSLLAQTELPSWGYVESSGPALGSDARVVQLDLPVVSAIGTYIFVIAGSEFDASDDETYLWKWDIGSLVAASE